MSNTRIFLITWGAILALIALVLIAWGATRAEYGPTVTPIPAAAPAYEDAFSSCTAHHDHDYCVDATADGVAAGFVLAPVDHPCTAGVPIDPTDPTHPAPRHTKGWVKVRGCLLHALTRANPREHWSACFVSYGDTTYIRCPRHHSYSS